MTCDFDIARLRFWLCSLGATQERLKESEESVVRFEKAVEEVEKILSDHKELHFQACFPLTFILARKR